jgi:hypothetical protein
MTDHQPPTPPPPPYDPPPPYAAQPPPYAQPAPYQTLSADQRRIMEGKGRRAIAFGAVWILFGLAITAVTFSMASASRVGGSYLVLWGPVVYGIIRIVQGYVLLNKSRG